jgi:hypothetical protein
MFHLDVYALVDEFWRKIGGRKVVTKTTWEMVFPRGCGQGAS